MLFRFNLQIPVPSMNLKSLEGITVMKLKTALDFLFYYYCYYIFRVFKVYVSIDKYVFKML